MGRNIEKVMMSNLIDDAINEKVESILGEYISTKKNSVTKEVYQRLGFTRLNDNQYELKELQKKAIPINNIKISKN